MIVTESLVNIHYNAHSQIFFLVMRTFNIYSWQLLSMQYSIINCIYQAMCYITIGYFLYLEIHTFWTNFIHVTYFLPTTRLGNQYPVLCMYELLVLFFFFLKIAQISKIIDYLTLISLCIMFSKSISVITNRLFMQNILTTLSNHLIWNMEK